MKEAEVIYYILKQFSQLKSPNGEFFYSVAKILTRENQTYLNLNLSKKYNAIILRYK